MQHVARDMVQRTHPAGHAHETAGSGTGGGMLQPLHACANTKMWQTICLVPSNSTCSRASVAMNAEDSTCMTKDADMQQQRRIANAAHVVSL